MSAPKIIALYLPQYHPTPDNDKWWGKGFTEWTNVGKAKPLFPGHYQPKIPADLGYYDLRIPQVREAQAELAKEAGIYGFCYYHYWFGNGKMELELPFQQVLKSGNPNFPFMLCWANESWHKKFWNKDGVGSSKEMLIEQTYPGDEDIINHFYSLLDAFKDDRYIKIDNKLAFMVYKPLQHPAIERFIEIWQKLAKKEGLPGFTFIGHLQSSFDDTTMNLIISKGFSYCNTVGLYHAKNTVSTGLHHFINRILHKVLKFPFRYDYEKISQYFITPLDKNDKVFPSIIPNWDHTPRSGLNGFVIVNSTPSTFKKNIQKMIDIEVSKNRSEKFIFLKSWNEWGEGNYMEPDLKFGKGYIHALRELIDKIE